MTEADLEPMTKAEDLFDDLVARNTCQFDQRTLLDTCGTGGHAFVTQTCVC